MKNSGSLLSLLTPAVLIAGQISTNAAKLDIVVDIDRQSNFMSKMYKFDKAGDYKGAVEAARQCMQLYACESYYGKALQDGKGIARNETEAVNIFTKYRDEFNLAKAYYLGRGVKRDLVEASLLAWHSGHNEYYDLCSAESCFEEENTLSQTIDAHLSYTQRQRVEDLKMKFYPIMARQQNALNFMDNLIQIGFGAISCVILILVLSGVALSMRSAFRALIKIGAQPK